MVHAKMLYCTDCLMSHFVSFLHCAKFPEPFVPDFQDLFLSLGGFMTFLSHLSVSSAFSIIVFFFFSNIFISLLLMFHSHVCYWRQPSTSRCLGFGGLGGAKVKLFKELKRSLHALLELMPAIDVLHSSATVLLTSSTFKFLSLALDIT